MSRKRRRRKFQQLPAYGVQLDSNGMLTFKDAVEKVSDVVRVGLDDVRIRQVVFPDSVQEIDSWAFSECPNLTDVHLPQHLIKIAGYAFSYCQKLSAVHFPESLIIIGQDAFLGCTSLEEVVLPRKLKALQGEAFAGCTSLRMVALPASLTRIEPRSFYNCTALAAVSIPEGLVQIEAEAFARCSSLEVINLPSTLRRIDAYAFSSCTSLKTLILPEGLEEIGADAFEGCKALTTVLFPSTLKNIGKGAFRGCSKLEQVVLPQSLQVLETEAFSDCTGLKRVSGGSQETQFKANALFGAASTVDLDLGRYSDASTRKLRGQLGVPDENGFIISGKTLTGYVGRLSRIAIPPGVEIIGEGVLPIPASRMRVTVEFPGRVRRIEQNGMLLRSTTISEPPVGYLQRAVKLPEFTLSLIKGPWKNHLRDQDLVALAMFQTWSAELPPFAAERIRCLSADQRAGIMVELLAKGQNATGRWNAANFFIENARSIPKQTKDKLAQLLGENLASRNGDLPYREAILDIVLKKHKVAANDPLFSAAKLKTGKPASSLLVKSALVPYILQAHDMKGVELDAIADAAAFIPDADEAAASLDPTSFQAVLRKLAGAQDDAVTYACARYGNNGLLGTIFRESSADLSWHGMNHGHLRRVELLVRVACLLNDASLADQMVLNAPEEIEFRSLWRQKNRYRSVLMPTLPSNLQERDGVFLASKETKGFQLRIVDGPAIAIFDRNAGKVHMQLRERDFTSHDVFAELRKAVDALKEYTATVQMRMDEALWPLFLSGNEVDPVWFEVCLNDPVAARTLSRIIFSQDGFTILFTENGPIACDGSTAAISSYEKLRIAHVREVPVSEMNAWRDLFRQRHWRSWQQQLEEPDYRKEGIKSNRFSGREVTYARIQDKPVRKMVQHALDTMNSGKKGNRISVQRNYATYGYRLGRCDLDLSSRYANRLVYQLDRLTAYERVLDGDASVVPFYALTDNTRLNKAVKAAIAGKNAGLTAVLLEIQQERKGSRKKTNPVDDLRL